MTIGFLLLIYRQYTADQLEPEKDICKINL